MVAGFLGCLKSGHAFVPVDTGDAPYASRGHPVPARGARSWWLPRTCPMPWRARCPSPTRSVARAAVAAAGKPLRRPRSRELGDGRRDAVPHLHVRLHGSPEGYRGRRGQRCALHGLGLHVSRDPRGRARIPGPTAVLVRPVRVRGGGRARHRRLPARRRTRGDRRSARAIRRPTRFGRGSVDVHAVVRRPVPGRPQLRRSPAARRAPVPVLRRGPAPLHGCGSARAVPSCPHREHVRSHRVDRGGHLRRSRDRRFGAG